MERHHLPGPRAGGYAESEKLTFELTGQQPDVGIKLGIRRTQTLNLANGMNHGRMVAASETPSDVGQRFRRQLLG